MIRTFPDFHSQLVCIFFRRQFRNLYFFFKSHLFLMYNLMPHPYYRLSGKCMRKKKSPKWYQWKNKFGKSPCSPVCIISFSLDFVFTLVIILICNALIWWNYDAGDSALPPVDNVSRFRVETQPSKDGDTNDIGRALVLRMGFRNIRYRITFQ